MAKNTKQSIYLCENCGNEFSQWSGRCTVCGEWNTLKEVKFDLPISAARNSNIEVTNIKDVKMSDKTRAKTGLNEFDRVLGGGIVKGSIILLGGEPGIGKSTLMLELTKNIDKILYISAEESLEQIKIRADRLKLNPNNLMLVSDGNIENIESLVAKNQPSLIIVDSIQTVYLPTYPSTPGSLVQVRECGIFLQRLSKKSGVPIFIVGHVTKEGSIAGPRILEHLVDVVLYLEGEQFQDFRILRGIKNRFGATNEVGIFSMQSEGLQEIKNPSALFLDQRVDKPGSVIGCTLEGTRPLLVEIQSIVVPTNFGYPKRTASGFDLNRLNLLAAVITKNTGVNLSNSDIYLNIVGGMKLREPALDLPVCVSMISSYKNRTLPKDYCFFGEVGLTGEVRKVTREQDRKKECQILGYKPVLQYKDLNQIIKEIS
jgi:DNA repair protein RadA/Sms